MLIWKKAPCVAIGVFAILALLLSIAVSQDIYISPSPDEYTTTVLVQTKKIATVQLMQLPFASGLTNPCSTQSTSSYVAAEGHRSKFEAQLFTVISHYANIYQEDAEEVLRNHTISGCDTLHVTNLPDTPTLDELKEMEKEEALNKIYTSLLLHSAYAYFIHHQFITSSIQCSANINGEQALATESYKLALKQKSLACSVRVGIIVLGYNENDLSSLLNTTISDLTTCSKRILRDCQVMKSIFNFLNVVRDYTQITDSTTTTY